MREDHSIQRTELDCKDVAALLSGLVDDVIEPELRHAAERHLAGCAACTSALDEAEALDVALAESLELVSELPEGFAERVLASTTREASVAGGRMRWIGWGGWIAAAASLALAASFYFTEWDRQASQPLDHGSRRVASNDAGTGSTGSQAEDSQASPSSSTIGDSAFFVAYPAGSELQSLARAGVVSGPLASPQSTSTNEKETNTRSTGDRTANGMLPVVDFTKLPMNGPVSAPVDGVGPEFGVGGPERRRRERSADADASSSPTLMQLGAGVTTLSRDDQDTLYAVANVLDMLVEFDVNSMRVAEHMREIVVYDELLNRLSEVRTNVSAQNRPSILAVEAILYRIVHGPVNDEDLRMIRSAAQELQLIEQLDRLAGHSDPDITM